MAFVLNPITGKFEIDSSPYVYKILNDKIKYLSYFTSVSVDTVLDLNHYLILASGTITITLPTAVGIQNRPFVIKNIGDGIITIATTSSQTVDGIAPQNMQVKWTSRTYISDGANWIII